MQLGARPSFDLSLAAGRYAVSLLLIFTTLKCPQDISIYARKREQIDERRKTNPFFSDSTTTRRAYRTCVPYQYLTLLSQNCNQV